ncbi:unnamed protein product, partial [Musa banksii]
MLVVGLPMRGGDRGRYFLKLPRTPGRGLEVSGAWLVWRLTSLDSSKGILGWRASWCICMDLRSGTVVLQWGHSSLAWPPFSWPDRSATPALPPPRFVVAASIFAAISFAVCFFGFAFPVMVGQSIGRSPRPPSSSALLLPL